MTIQEKRPLVFLVIDIISFSVYYTILSNHFGSTLISMGELPFWGASILLLIPIMILSRIILYIIYSIVNSLVNREKEGTFLIDELGEIIKLKASRNFNNTFLLGFVITMALLVLGISVSSMFKMLFFSIFAAFTVHNLSAYYYLRKGI